MRDLYAIARLPSDATFQSIGGALPRLTPSDRLAVEMILLDTRRRAIYDRTRAVVEEVGRVRAILGERVADLNWGPHYADFQFTSPKESESRTPNDSKPPRRSRRAAVVVFIVLVLAAGFIFSSYLVTSEAGFGIGILEPQLNTGSPLHTQARADPTISHPTDLLPANASDPPQAVVHRSRNGSGTYIDDRHPSRGGTAAIQDSPQTEPLELPETGLINTFEDGVAPFQVSVPHGDSHYYVKIEGGLGASHRPGAGVVMGETGVVSQEDLLWNSVPQTKW